MAPQSALRTASIRTKRARNETYTRRKLLEESTSPGLQKNKPGTTEMPKTEGAQLACEGTGPPGPAACLANFCRCPHRPSRA